MFTRPRALDRKSGMNNQTVLIFGWLLAVAVLVSVPVISNSARSPRPVMGYLDTSPEFRTGTIQLLPAGSNLCPQLAFNNDTGQLRERGLVPCGTSLSADPPLGEKDRLGLVRKGFIGR